MGLRLLYNEQQDDWDEYLEQNLTLSSNETATQLNILQQLRVLEKVVFLSFLFHVFLMLMK